MVSEYFHCRQTGNVREYLVKWKELGYEDTSWEVEEDISMFDVQIERYDKLKSRRAITPKKRKGPGNDREVQKKRKEFKAFEETPKCLIGGLCHFQAVGVRHYLYSIHSLYFISCSLYLIMF